MSSRNKPPTALVLHSPYTSIQDYAREKAGSALGSLLVSERWPTKRHLARVKCPILLIHGDRDEVIPFRHALRLKKESKTYKASCALHVQKGVRLFWQLFWLLFGIYFGYFGYFGNRHVLAIRLTSCFFNYRVRTTTLTFSATSSIRWRCFYENTSEGRGVGAVSRRRRWAWT